MGESLFNKVVDCRPATLLKRDSERGSYEIASFFGQLLLQSIDERFLLQLVRALGFSINYEFIRNFVKINACKDRCAEVIIRKCFNCSRKDLQNSQENTNGVLSLVCNCTKSKTPFFRDIVFFFIVFF